MSFAASQRPLRIGIVPYLNVQPLVWSLSRSLPPGAEPDCPPARIIPEVPRRLAASLRSGHFDAAIVPVFEYLLNPTYTIVPGVSIASRGPVYSVALFSETPLDQIRTVRLDSASLTSVNLVKVLLAERGLDIVYLPLSAADTPGKGSSLPAGLEPGLGQVLIGDPAMARRNSHRYEYDLGALWTEQTGLPFVFAAWLVPPASRSLPLAATLREAARTGRSSLQQVATETASRFGFSTESALRYFRENMVYDLGDDELAGWQHFARLCARHGLIGQVPTFRFQER